MPHVGDNGYLDKEIENIRRYIGKQDWRQLWVRGAYLLPLLTGRGGPDRLWPCDQEQSFVRVYLIDEQIFHLFGNFVRRRLIS